MGVIVVAILNLALAAVEHVLERVASRGLRLWHVLVILVDGVRTLALGTVLAFLDVEEHLTRFLLLRAPVDVLPAEAADHALEDVPNLSLEVVLVIVRPLQESRDEVFEMGAHNVGGHSVDGQLDEAEDSDEDDDE